MKPHTILKSFKGNQTGNGPTEEFKAGTVADLSRDLAAIAVKEGWAAPVATGESPVKAAPQKLEEFRRDLPEARETKVVAPEETKIITPSETKSTDDMDFAELKALAKTKGIKIFGMSEAKLRAALKADA